MPYKIKGKCIYRSDTGKKVGCTKGEVKKYLAALHANVKETCCKENSMKLRRILESGYNRKLITIECSDSGGELMKLLKWMESMGNIGHSAVIHCDVEQPSDLVKIFWDGDGSDKIYSINVKTIKEK